MRNNKYLAWTSFSLFILNIGIILLFILFASMFINIIENPGILILVTGALAIIGMIMGFLSFKVPQAKVGGVGGLLVLLLVLFVIPVGRQTTVPSPVSEANPQGQAGYTNIPEIDAIIATVLTGSPQEELQLLQFSMFACTHADGLGGPPKCREGEAEGTPIEAFPFLGPEGHHMRRNEADVWTGIQASDVYAVYRVSDQVYSDETYPAGEYAIMFLDESGVSYTTAQVRDGKIIRLDTVFDLPSEIDLDRVASEIILPPQK